MATNKLIGTLLLRIAADTKSLRTGMAKTQSATAKLKKQVIGLGVAMAGAFAGRVVLKGMRSMVNVMATFEQSMADVRSVTRATGEEFARLSRLAQGLGRTTKFTASQVAQLEKEYAKLGFSTTEIENAAEATLNLAAAVGAELARAAEVAGGTIRGFQLDAKESTRVTDVMAESFTNTALDMEKFAESMKFIAPVANIADVSLEETTALLGILANNMIDGSMAGTSLRRIFLELAGTGEPLIQRLEELSERGLTLADAEDEVGKRALTALIVLTQQLEMLPKLTEAYENAGGAAQEMAEVQLDTLKGELALLKSAYEGLIIKMGESGDAMGASKKSVGILRKSIGFLTDNLKEVGIANKAWFLIMVPGVRLFALFTKGVDSMRGSLEKLGDWFKDNFTLNKSIKETLGTSFEEFMAMERFGALGKGGPSFIGQPKPRGEKPDFKFTDVTGLFPQGDIPPAGNQAAILREVTAELLKNADATIKAAIAHEQYVEWLFTTVEAEENVKDGTDELTKSYIENMKLIEEKAMAMTMALQSAFSSLAVGMAQSFANMITGTGNFFTEMAKLIADIAVLIGGLLIAIGTAFIGSGLFAGFGGPMVAAGAGLVVAGQVASNLIGQSNKGITSSGLSGGNFQTQSITVTGRISGRDIAISNSRGTALIGGTTG